jgi:hypothetical protein
VDGALAFVTGRAPARPARHRVEWVLPLVVLDCSSPPSSVLQFAVFFGGRSTCLRTAGLTAAEHARQGFFQLLAVAAMTLALVGRRRTPAGAGDRSLLRVLLGALCGLTGVVLLSAAQRLHRYQDAFGFTRLRLVVDVAIIWIAVVLVLVCVAGVLWRAGWLPRAVLASAVIALLALNVVNADAFVARRNVARYAAGDAIDTFYLAELGADAVPELDRLPEPARSCALRGAATRLDRLAAGGWRGANLARARARDVLAARPAGACTTVDGRSRAAAAGARSRPALVLRRPNGYRPERAAKPQAKRSEPISQSSEGGPGTPPLVSGPALGDLGAAGVAAPIDVSAHLPGGAGSGHVRVCYRTPFGMRLSPSGNLAGPLGVPMTTTPLVEGRPLDDSELVARARSGTCAPTRTWYAVIRTSRSGSRSSLPATRRTRRTRLRRRW